MSSQHENLAVKFVSELEEYLNAHLHDNRNGAEESDPKPPTGDSRPGRIAPVPQ